jgi:acyl dehydratase
MTTTPLRQLAKAVKSANAGATWLTLDVVFDDFESYERVRATCALTADVVASTYAVEPADVRVFECPQIKTLKVTLPRRTGELLERDFDGVQQFAPLLDLPVPEQAARAEQSSGVTDEMFADLARWLNVVRPTRGWNSSANSEAVQHFAQGIGDDNPLWWQPVSPGVGGVPPTFLYSCSNGSADPFDDRIHPAESWLPGTQSVWLGDRWWFGRPVHRGEAIAAAEELVEIREGASERFGRTVTIVDRTSYCDAAGELIATCDKTMLRRSRGASATTGSGLAPTPLRQHNPDEIDAIRARHEAETGARRGATPRMIEDVEIGDRLPELVKGPLTLTEIIGWLLGWGSPMAVTSRMLSASLAARPGARVHHPNGLADTIEAAHWDPDLARAAGFTGPFDFGAQRISWAAHLVTDWCGDSGFLRGLDARLKRPNVLGDVTILSGTVTEVAPDADQPSVTCAVAATNQRGEVTLEATAVVELPRRGRG